MDEDEIADPIEQSPQYKKVIHEVEKEAEANLKKKGLDFPGRMGYCHSLWGEIQRILKEKHGIEWKTPAEMNPMTIFD